MTLVGLAAEGMIKKASSSGSLRLARRMKRYVEAERWLQKRNRYRADVRGRIRTDCAPGGPGISSPHLSAYVAASAPLHCSDGWTLLGKALASHAMGDASTAVHLAYYAELRAAMSLLAVGGVGVFDTIHFAMDAAGMPSRILGNHSTHTLAWEALRVWSATPSAASIVSNSIKPAGLPLADWLATYPPLAAWGPIATAWLQAWGVDIARYAGDQDARNEASYRPTALLYRRSVDVTEAYQYLVSFWRLMEPGDSTFAPLDRSLLRETLRTAHKATGIPDAFDDVIAAVVANAGLAPGAEATWVPYLTAAGSPDLVIRAGRLSPPASPDLHLEVISRAALLLRVATGAAANYLNAAEIDSESLRFWWTAVGEDAGLWSGSAPDALVDLWADVVAAIDSIESAGVLGSYFATAISLGAERTVLSQTERPMLWGLTGN